MASPVVLPRGGCCVWVLLLLLCAAAAARAAASRGPSPAGVAGAEDDDPLAAEMHERWMAKHGRAYEDEAEKRHRRAVFKRNVELVESFNRLEGRQYELGVNKFADQTDEELNAACCGFRLASRRKPTGAAGRGFLHDNDTVKELPLQRDWRKEGAVTGVKDQKRCGCCWAFSVVAAVEGITQIKTGSLISLSEQQLVDCDTGDGNEGCNGGTTDDAFQFVVDNGGLASEEAYPYRGADGICNAAASSPNAAISSYDDVPANDEGALLHAVARRPVSVAIDAGGFNFKYYKGGVFTGPCGTDLNHAVAVVGYGATSGGTKYWLIKNSWGDTWGEAGYMRMQRDVAGDRRGLCGIAMQASFPIA